MRLGGDVLLYAGGMVQVAEVAEVDGRASADSRRPVRRDIQALRAFAVMSVVVYHVWPSVMPGGFVGVDVFFVISGFLITSHLLSEVERRGTVRTGRFWARRIRRLLPASCTVLAVSLALVVLVAPRVSWALNLRDVRTGAAYVENWALASRAVDYLAAQEAPGVAQHYWSLAVEEQLYLVWPLLVLAAARASWWPGGSARARVGRALALVTAVSFVAGLVWTWATPAPAFFNTFGRAWEFGVGGLVAVWRLGEALGERARAVWAWVAVVVLGATAFLLPGHEVSFPGWAALVPVGAAALFLVAGESRLRTSPTRYYASPAVQWLGDHSYGIYLWHWPFVVLLPFVTGHPVGLVDGVALVAGTFVAAWVTKRWVEDPFRGGAWTRSTRGAFLFALVGPGLLVASSTLLLHRVDRGVAESAARVTKSISSGEACVGAAAMGPGCPDRFRRPDDFDSAFADRDYDAAAYDCQVDADSAEVKICRFGRADSPRLRVALVGNSHAVHLVPALTEYGRSRGWEVLLAAQTDCLGVDRAVEGGQSPGCARRARELPRLLEREGVDVVVFASHDNAEGYVAGPSTSRAQVAEAEARTVTSWRRYVDRGMRVLVLGDVPGVRPESGPACVAVGSPDDPCARPRDEVARDNLFDVVARRHPELVAHHALAPLMCDDDRCHAMVGGVSVYRDAHHLTRTYARTMADDVGGAVARAARR